MNSETLGSLIEVSFYDSALITCKNYIIKAEMHR